jgi:putative ABC transport system substrate-binding protein
VLLVACGSAPPARTYTIGVVNYVPVLEQVLAGFKARMATSGYEEGRNVTYLYQGVLAPDAQVIEQEVQRLLTQKVDLLLTLGTPTTIAARKAVAGTNIPVVFAPVVTPVKEGVVESLSHPGGNVTGVQNGDTIPKSLEWLHKIVPQATKFYTIYHPGDKVALTATTSLPAVASTLGIELVLTPVHSQAEAIAVMDTLPRDAALFMVPTPSLEPLSAVLDAAVKRGIAVGTNEQTQLKAGAVVSYAGSFAAMGEQAARLVEQILKGSRPADLPVETAEGFLHINLQAATAVGLDIPDGILRLADMVMR